MIRRSPKPACPFAALTVFVAACCLSGAAAAAGANEAQARKALKQAVDEDYLETRFDDAENRLRGAIQRCDSGCSAALRAQLHAALAAVLATGKKELDDARDEFAEALMLDPSVEPDPGMVSTGVTFAFDQAKKKLKIGPYAPASATPAKPKEPGARKDDEPEPKRPADAAGPRDTRPKDVDTKDEPRELPPARKNWITLTFSPDVSIVSGTNVCTKENQREAHYVCIREDAGKTRYNGTPTKDNGDNINTGVALSTLRVMLAYDRLIVDNLTLGARVGFAFNGANDGGASFLPVHLEGRVGYWPGKTPFVGNVVRPYMMISGGLAQIDTKVSVEVLEDGNACGAKSPGDSKSPCTLPVGMPEPRVQKLTAYKQAGLGFGSLAFGVHFVPSPIVALYLAARVNITFPVVTGVLSPEGGLALGF